MGRSRYFGGVDLNREKGEWEEGGEQLGQLSEAELAKLIEQAIGMEGNASEKEVKEL